MIIAGLPTTEMRTWTIIHNCSDNNTVSSTRSFILRTCYFSFHHTCLFTCWCDSVVCTMRYLIGVHVRERRSRQAGSWGCEEGVRAYPRGAIDEHARHQG